MGAVLNALLAFGFVVLAIIVAILACVIAVFIIMTVWALLKPVFIGLFDKWYDWFEERTDI